TGCSTSGRCRSRPCRGASAEEFDWQEWLGLALRDWSSSFAPQPRPGQMRRAESQSSVQMRVPSKPPRRQNRLRKAKAPSTGKFYSAREPFANNLLDGFPKPHGREIPFANPSHLANVGSCFGFSGDRPAQVVNQHV